MWLSQQQKTSVPFGQWVESDNEIQNAILGHFIYNANEIIP